MLGFEVKIRELKDVYEMLNDCYSTVSARLSAIPHVGGATEALMRMI
jgi:hypothetical protein